MSREETFNTEEMDRIDSILKKAHAIKDREERANFVHDECGDNLVLLESVLADLDEMEIGEPGFESASLSEGDTAGNYRILSRINRGGTASVFLAEHITLGKLAAIKVFDNVSAGESAADRFWNQENKSLARLDHDNIIKLFDVGEIPKGGKRFRYIAVEYVNGVHLDEFCSTRATSLREIIRIFLDVCEIVDYIHNAGIRHLDLKPKNILVTKDLPRRVKLIDFGSSRSSQPGVNLLTKDDLMTPLTLKFAAPEQLDPLGVPGLQADVYSLGVILYLLITGRLPFGEGETNRDEIRRIVADLSTKPQLPSACLREHGDEERLGLGADSLSRRVKGDLDAIVMKALEKRRRARYKSVADLRRDLENLLKGRPVSARRSEFGYRLRRTLTNLLGFRGASIGWPRWKTPVRRLAVIALVTASAGFACYWIYRNQVVRARKTFVLAETTVRAYDQLGNPTKIRPLTLNVFCESETPPLCFSFVLINAGTFQIGKRPDDPYGTVFGKPAPKTTPPTQIKTTPFPPSVPPPSTALTSSRPSAPAIAIKDSQFKDPGVTGEKPQEGGIRQLDQSMAADPMRPAKITRPFYMGRFEVTNRQWNIVAKLEKVGIDLIPTDAEGSRPHSGVSFAEAIEFCARLESELTAQSGTQVKVRLPSEAEWEYACREGVDLAGKNDRSGLPDFFNAMVIAGESPPPYFERVLRNVNQPVSEFSLFSNSLGLAGMNGNLWEMTADDWTYGYVDRLEIEQNAFKANGENPEFVLRGGAYNTESFMAQCYYRQAEDRGFIGKPDVGFRVVVEGDFGKFAANNP